MLMALLPLAGWAEDLSSASVAVGDVTYGTAAIGEPMVVWEGETLTKDTHYTLDTKFYKEQDGAKVVAGTTLATLPVGTYYVKVTGVPANGFNGDAYGEFKVTRANLTITVTSDPDPITKVYDGTTTNPTGVTLTWAGTGYQNGETDATGGVSGTLTWSYSNPNAGDRAITFDGLSSANYTITYAAKNITITQKPLAAGMVTAANFTKDYKGAAYTPNTDFAVTVKDGSTTLAQGTDYAVKVYEEEGMTTEDASPRNAGTYYVGVVGLAGTNYSGGPIAVGTLTINKANLTVLANDQAIDYDGATKVSDAFDNTDYQFIGLVGEDNAASITGAKTIAISPAADAAKVVAGTYTIAPDQATFTNANYNIFVQNGTFTINKLALTIKADNKTMTLGQAEPEYTATITGAVGTEENDMRDAAKGNVMVARETGDDDALGAHTLVVSYNADADVFKNYNVTATNGTLTISGGTIVVTVKPQTIAYGDDETWSTPQEGRDYFVNGIAEEDKANLTVTLTRANASTKTPGTYAITASANTPTGYSAVNYVNSTLTINKRELQVTALAQTLAVGQAVDGLDLSKIEFAEGHGLAFDDEAEDILKLQFAAGVTVDATTKKLTTAGDFVGGIEVALITDPNANYTLTPTAGDLTVTNALVLNRPAKAVWEADNSTDDAAAVIASANGKTVDVTFGTFAMTAEKWYPIVLPFATTVREVSANFGYAVVNILNTANTDNTKIAFKLHMGAIPANTPFVVKIDEAKNMNTVTFADKTIVESAAPEVADASGVKFIGSYSHKVGFAANEYFFSVSASKNDYYYGSATNTTYMAPLSAYFQVPDGEAAARTIEFEEPDGNTTAIKVVNTENKVSGEGWYTIGGVKLQSAPVEKGVYIRNGKKVVVK